MVNACLSERICTPCSKSSVQYGLRGQRLASNKSGCVGAIQVVMAGWYTDLRRLGIYHNQITAPLSMLSAFRPTSKACPLAVLEFFLKEAVGGPPWAGDAATASPRPSGRAVRVVHTEREARLWATLSFFFFASFFFVDKNQALQFAMLLIAVCARSTWARA